MQQEDPEDRISFSWTSSALKRKGKAKNAKGKGKGYKVQGQGGRSGDQESGEEVVPQSRQECRGSRWGLQKCGVKYL